MVLTVGSLFSGIGGIELGFERAGGFNTSWFVEDDKYASAILKKHWPKVPNLGDITKVNWEEVERVDLLTGGFPCQDISYAGKGAGIKEGTRSGLWKEYFRAIRTLQPKFVFVENVPALLSRGLDIVLGDLASVGYDAEWESVPASSVGAPHRRDRVFILAYSQCSRQFQSGSPFKKRCNSHKINTPQPKSPDLAYSDSKRFKKQCRPESAYQRTRWPKLKRDRWWEVEPDVGRVADGVSFRVDRIKCLGNAVVPQVAQFIAQRVKE